MIPVKYITNKELLAEIHRAKLSYCSFERPEYSRFDVIVHSLDEVTPELLKTTLDKKLEMIAKKGNSAWEGANDEGEYSEESLVIRLMTDAHIPVDDGTRRRRANETSNAVRTVFPPFAHYVMRDGKLKEVGRAFWQGSLSNGEFYDQGRISNRLAHMFMLLVDRYSRRANWRSYCCDETTEALTKRGWLNMDQINEDDTILSYLDGQLKWSSIKSIYRGDHDGKMFHLTVEGMDALVTPGHKFVTKKGIKQVEHLCDKDSIILGGDAVEDGSGQYSDAFVEMVGCVVTEGAPGEKRNVMFNLTKNLCQQIEAVANNKVLSMEFILALTQHQRELLIETMIDADGLKTDGHKRYAQKDRKHVDAFLALCTMAGHLVSMKHNKMVTNGVDTHIHIMNFFADNYKSSNVENMDFHGAKGSEHTNKDKHPNEPTVDYTGRVWCPETEFGSFMCRRNGYIFCTGNSYNDEFKSSALLQLSQTGLKFDESKSDNPFAFYTQVIKHAFTRILNNEKKVQHIRDDLLMMAGAAPSFARQIEHEMAQRQEAKIVPPPLPSPEPAQPSEPELLPPLPTPSPLPKKRAKKAKPNV